MELQNQTALVTGGASGIGRETALLLAREGALVIISGRNAAKGAEAVAEIEAAGGKARFITADLSDLASVARLAEDAGEVDILVNNAGAFPFAPALEQGLDTFQELFDTNVRGPFFLTSALAGKMVAKGSGSIINVTTIAGLRGMPDTAAYGATKAAVDSFTRTWAAEFGGRGVRVNAIAPGHTKTENVTSMIGEEEFEEAGAATPLARLGRPREIAEAILFLASPRSSYITGVTLAVDGGYMAQG
ncbi:MAG: family NAD(P)-dependent oxidoreductase [Actinomycetia bacterium]|jgi:NAD(P)-dependent dehydrogenase (short-subunit alcohol dehydrogenase family)|nr:family NAD(P)-dependent oxidoreductase [Actinomycetes bacterium]